MKRTLLMTVLAAALLFSACNTQTSDDKGSISGTPATGEDFVASRDLYVNLTDLSYSNDGTTWSDITTTEAQTLSSEGTIKLNSSNGYFIIADLTETTAKCAVHLTGTLPASTYTTGVRIKTNKNIECGVYLEDVTITSTNMPCIEMTKNGLVSLGFTGTNTLTDGRTFGTGYGPEYSTTSGATYTDSDGNTQTCTTTTKVCSTDNANASDSKAALYAKGSMTLFQKGTGTLTVSQGYKHNISSGCALVLQSGTYTLSSTAKSALYGEEWVELKDSDITVTTTGTITTSSVKKAHAVSVNDDDYENSYILVSGGTLNATVYNGKGLAAPIVKITGGTNTLNVTGVTNFTNDNNQTGTYTDADGVKESGSITFSAEAIEGTTSVNISDGTTEITCSDDGINVSDSTASSNFTMSGGKLYICTSNGDGIDSNSNIYISGGTVVSIALTGSEDAFDCGDNQGSGGGQGGFGGMGGQSSSSTSKTYGIRISGGMVAGCSGSSNGSSDTEATENQKILYTTSVTSSSNYVVLNNGTELFAFTTPSASSGSGSGRGGSSSGIGLLTISCPDFTASSYSSYKGATISGGSSFHGLYTTLPTVSSNGSSCSFTVISKSTN